MKPLKTALKYSTLSVLGAFSISFSASAHEEAPTAELAALMLGHVGTQDAKIWVQSDEEVDAHVVYWSADQPSVKRQTAAAHLSEANYLIHTFELKDLKPTQQYQYAVYFDDQRQTPEPLSFQTISPIHEALSPLSFLVGSCYYLDDPLMQLFKFSYGGGMEIFESMAQEQAKAMIWTGDNIYFAPFDLSNRYNMNQRYKKQRQHPALKNFLTRMPHYAIWDDHDFGPNNSSRRFSGANDATQLFKAYWANPRYGSLAGPGIYFSQQWQDVDFIITDNRTYRDPNNFPDPMTRSFFGRTQMDWIKNELLGSRATFKIVVIGSPVFNRYYKESFYQATGEFQELMEFLDTKKIEGVVFLSGDRHHSDLSKMERSGAYPLYNFVNSPLTSQPTKLLSEAETTDNWRVPGSLIRERNYGKLRIEGPAGSRVLHLDTLNATGKRIWTYAIPEQELKYSPGKDGPRI